MTPQPGYPQPVAHPGAVPAGAMMTGPAATGAQPAQIQRPAAPAGAGDLPEWAKEPERRPLVLLAFGFALSAVGWVRPGWLAILAAVLTVIAGTVGRAQDARRWNRLQRGSALPTDTSRMWAATPWYLVRSLFSVGFAFLLALGVGVIVMLTTSSLGMIDENSSTFGSVSLSNRFVIIVFTVNAAYLLALWLAPWGAATRRGGAHLVNKLVSSTRARRSLGLGLVIVGVIALLLCFANVVPAPSFSPFLKS